MKETLFTEPEIFIKKRIFQIQINVTIRKQFRFRLQFNSYMHSFFLEKEVFAVFTDVKNLQTFQTCNLGNITNEIDYAVFLH